MDLRRCSDAWILTLSIKDGNSEEAWEASDRVGILGRTRGSLAMLEFAFTEEFFWTFGGIVVE